MTIYAQIIGGCWLAFLAVWIVAMLTGGGRTQRYAPSAGPVRLLLVVTIALGAVFGRRMTAYSFASFTEGVAASGCALCILGLAFAVWARVALGRNWGMPMTERVEPELIVSGPYRFIRHPIYSGLILAMIGTVLVTNVLGVVLVVLLGGSFVYSATVEERNLLAAFPTEYPAYRQRTKMLVPFLL